MRQCLLFRNSKGRLSQNSRISINKKSGYENEKLEQSFKNLTKNKLEDELDILIQ